MRILVLGGYGLIGACVVRHLLDAGHEVVGLGRDVGKARLQLGDARWIAADISRLASPQEWAPILRDAAPDAIVNCAGILQDGARDDVAAVQSQAMQALYRAAVAVAIAKFVQISAPRAGGETVFMRTKGEADAALAASTLDWVVLRPGLVVAPQAYGGTALLRALAAMPWVQPLAYADARLQTVAVDDVANAVVASVEGRVPGRRTYDLVEDESHALGDVVQHLRAWLGIAAAPRINVPTAIIRGVARIADGLGWLGWRSPLRSTALDEIAAGVTGDAAAWRAATGHSLRSLDLTLRIMPSTIQERWFARAFLLKPLAIGTLGAFWVVTGLVTLARPDDAAHILRVHGMAAFNAYAIAIGGAAIDIILGGAVLVRRAMSGAAVGMIATTVAYLIGGSILAPSLWLDPLGPLVKTIPAAVLALVVLALAEDR